MKKALQVIFSFAILGVIYIAQGNSGGPGWGYTSAPGSSTCNSCHSTFSLQTTGPLHKRIELRMNSFVGGGYLPDSTYEFLLVFKDTLNSKAGFQITALDGNDNPAGIFATVDTRTQIGSSVVGGKTRRYIGHRGTGNTHQGTDSISWRIKWTAPSTNVGQVIFYANVVSANQLGGNSGDYVFGKTFTAKPSNLLPTAKAVLKTTKPCRRTPLEFEATTTGSPTKYDWDFPGASPSSSSLAKPTVEYLGSGPKTVYLKTTNSYGDSETDTFRFTALSGPFKPLIQEAVGGFVKKCNMDNIALTVPLRSSENYIWLPDSVNQDTFVATKAGQISVRSVLTTTGCTVDGDPIQVVNYDSTFFSVKKISSDTLCSNVDSIRIKIESGSSIMESFVLDGSDTLSKNMQTIALRPELANGDKTYMVYARDSNNCLMSTQAVSFHFKAQESGPTLLPTTMKTLDGLRLNWNSSPKALAYEVSINGNAYFPSNSGGNDTFYMVAGLKPGTRIAYKVRSVIFSHCLNSIASKGVDSTFDCPALTFKSIGDTAYCKGDTAKIEVSNIGIQKHKLFVNGVESMNNMEYTLQEMKSQLSEVYISDSTGLCMSDTQTIRIKYDSIDRSSLDTSYKPLCMANGSTKDISFSLTPATSNTYNWYLNNSLVKSGSQTSQSISVKNNDQLFVEAQKGVCSINSDTITIAARNALDCKITATRKTDGIYSIVSSEKGVAHQWSINGAVQGNTMDSFDYDFTSLAGSTAKIKQTINLGSNCNCTDSISLDLTVLSLSNPKELKYAVFPNPANSYIKVTSLDGVSNLPYKILSINGTLVKKGVLSRDETLIRTDNISNGIYQLCLGESQKDIFKITIMH